MSLYIGNKKVSPIILKGESSANLKTKSITSNGTYNASDDDADGYSSVTVNVSNLLQNKSVNPSKTIQYIDPDTGYSGLSRVTINPVTSAIDSNITSNNIKEGVTILGVTGELAASTTEDDEYDYVSLRNSTRPSEWPDIPLPSEITETLNTVYLLYGINDYNMDINFSNNGTVPTITVDAYSDNTFVRRLDTIFSRDDGLMYSPALNKTFNTQSYFLNYEADDYNYVIVKILNAGGISFTDGTKYINDHGDTIYVNGTSQYLFEISAKTTNDINLCNASGIDKLTFLKYFSCVGTSRKDWSYQFNTCKSLICLPEFQIDTSKHIRDTSYMFKNCYSLIAAPNMDLSESNTRNYMFNNCESLEYVPNYDYTKLEYAQGLFDGCISLQNIPEITAPNLSYAQYIFRNCYSLKKIPIKNFVKSSYLSYAFANCRSITSLDLNTSSSLVSIDSLCDGCYSLRTVRISDTTSLTSMRNTFQGCHCLTKMPDIDTSNVTNMSYAFCQCFAVTSINPNYDFSKVTNLNNTFSYCYSLTEGTVDAQLATNAGYLFAECYNLKYANVNLPNATSIGYIFYNDYALHNVEFTGYNASSVSNASNAFKNTYTLQNVYFYDITSSIFPQFNSSYYMTGTVNNIYNPQGREGKIYVPSDMVDTLASAWTTVSTAIEAIPDEE